MRKMGNRISIPIMTAADGPCIRYGVGETLFRFTDQMEIEPWLAESYERVDERTWRITLKEGISFTSGRVMDAEAVKECLEALVEANARAAGNLRLETVTAEGLTLTIGTKVPSGPFELIWPIPMDHL